MTKFFFCCQNEQVPSQQQAHLRENHGGNHWGGQGGNATNQRVSLCRENGIFHAAVRGSQPGWQAGMCAASQSPTLGHPTALAGRAGGQLDQCPGREKGLIVGMWIRPGLSACVIPKGSASSGPLPIPLGASGKSRNLEIISCRAVPVYP